MSKTAINDLQALVHKLQDQRKAHVDAILDIDKAFTSFGIKPTKMGRRRSVAKKAAAGMRIGKKKTAKKTRRRYKMTSSELVRTVIAKAGKKGITSTEISKAWRAAGRPGDAYKVLGELAEAKKIRRRLIKGRKRGSLYTMA